MVGSMQKKRWGVTFCLSTLALSLLGCHWDSDGRKAPEGYPIAEDVYTTVDRTIAFPAITPGLQQHELDQVERYGQYGYGNWQLGNPLSLDPRADPSTFGIMPAGYDPSAVIRKARLLNFFAMTDIHLTDKESPAQLIYLQQAFYPTPIPIPGSTNPNYPWGMVTSVYSPVMLYTPHVLDAAVQTVNALHKQPGKAFDFGITIGDVANSTQYNELRWFIDVMDGQVITPSSGAHVGAESIDYQKPFKAVGLDKSIPWYQTMGNHDHFFIGSFPVNAALRQSFISDTVLATGDVLLNPLNINDPRFYMGVLDGSTPFGNIIKAGHVVDFNNPPKVVADPDRRSLLRTEFMSEFSKTTTNPQGHGFNLVDPEREKGFACYSFVPKSDIPIKVIVLDNTQREDDGDPNIHGHGFLDPARWAWLKKELADGDAADQLMIISAHIPIGVQPLGSNFEWWDNSNNKLGTQNAVNFKGLMTELYSHPNLILWIAGHLHQNTVNAFHGPTPEQSFWQVQTSSLRDYPQQFRTFDIAVNSDYNISINAINVDPAVLDGTPAAISRKYAVAAQQICQTAAIYQNSAMRIDPDTQIATNIPDTSIKPMPTGSYNATLYKQLTPKMKARLQSLFP